MESVYWEMMLLGHTSISFRFQIIHGGFILDCNGKNAKKNKLRHLYISSVKSSKSEVPRVLLHFICWNLCSSRQIHHAGAAASIESATPMADSALPSVPWNCSYHFGRVPHLKQSTQNLRVFLGDLDSNWLSTNLPRHAGSSEIDTTSWYIHHRC